MNDMKNTKIAAFMDAAIQEFPSLAGASTITRKQVKTVMAKYGLPWPSMIANDSVSRGVYAIPELITPTRVYKEPETDEQILNRMRERYSAMQLCVRAAGEGKSKSVIISGPAGVGKSYGVHQVLDKMAEENPNVSFNFVSGYTRPLGLYKLLYENRFSDSVLVLDDIDSAFSEEVSLNILKKACDMSDKRRISWLSEVKLTDEDGEDIPKTFDFEGSIVFITNMDFDAQVASNSKLAPHFNALISRSLYIDLAIKTSKEYMLRIRQVVEEEGMLTQQGYTTEEQNIILEYVEANANKIRELSLRMVSKLATIYKIDPKNWVKLANAACLRVA